MAERVLGKDEVTSSILVIGSNLCCRMRAEAVDRSSLVKKASGGGLTGQCKRYGWRVRGPARDMFFG